MSKEKMIKILKQYQESPLEQKERFWRDFEEKMIYRTTKTENPQTSKTMVRDVLKKLEAKV